MTADRPRCSAFLAMSLDGFIARKDGSIDWLARVELPDEDYGFQRFFDSVDTLAIGRSTWEVARAFDPWPYQGKRCVVLTHRPLDALHGEESFAGSAWQLVEQFSTMGTHHVYVDGGTVVRQFLAAGLLDALTVSIIPLVLGEGIPLFGGALHEHGLVLEESRSWPSGLLQVRYRVADR